MHRVKFIFGQRIVLDILVIFSLPSYLITSLPTYCFHCKLLHALLVLRCLDAFEMHVFFFFFFPNFRFVILLNSYNIFIVLDKGALSPKPSIFLD